MRAFLLSIFAAAGLLTVTPTPAALLLFRSYVGAYDLSSDGCGSVTQACTLRVNAPAGGASVVGAFLYTSTNGAFAPVGNTFFGGTFSGERVTYTNIGASATNPNLTTGRADVTSIVQTAIGNTSGVFSFGVNETLNAQGVDIQNGEALVVVFMLPSGATRTIGILDGVSSASGDTASIAFADPLDTSAPGFAAEMRIGVGHSFDGADQNNPNSANQISQITVNGSTSLTNAAGHCDDARDSACTNGNLITMGGDNDLFTPFNPTVGQDHERYNLLPAIAQGAHAITINTRNLSSDDIVFLETFKVTGNGVINGVPEPTPLALIGAGLCAVVLLRRRLPG